MTQLEMIEQQLVAHAPSVAEAAAIAQGEFLRLASQPKKTKTLILDLDETLVHSSFSPPEHYDFEVPVQYGENIYPIYVQKRPGLDSFLSSIVYDFDLYIFTASMPEYSLPVVQELIPNFPESRILTRRHCRLLDGFLVKDLTIFRRDLSGIILVDNSPCSYQLQPANGVPIPTWTGGSDDLALTETIGPFLALCKGTEDVRPLITAAFLSE